MDFPSSPADIAYFEAKNNKKMSNLAPGDTK